MLSADQRKRLQKGVTAEVRFDCLLKPFTTFRIGGPADALVELTSTDEILFLARFCLDEKIPWLCIGNGSNLLIADAGIAGVVFFLGKSFEKVEFLVQSQYIEDQTENSPNIIAGAAISLAKLSHLCMEKGLSGLEFSSGIPGTLGGATVMNAGAWGGEMAQVIRSVEVAGVNGVKTLDGDSLDYSYRMWPEFQRLAEHEMLVVTSVKMKLNAGKKEEIASRCRELAERRKKIQRVHLPSAGSFFRNPPGKSAGQLIENAGCKGLRIGDAMVAEEHANFLINMGEATAADVLALQEEIVKRVEAKFSVTLQPEVRFVGI